VFLRTPLMPGKSTTREHGIAEISPAATSVVVKPIEEASGPATT
jgi:hypothetical protein